MAIADPCPFPLYYVWSPFSIAEIDEFKGGLAKPHWKPRVLFFLRSLGGRGFAQVVLFLAWAKVHFNFCCWLALFDLA